MSSRIRNALGAAIAVCAVGAAASALTASPASAFALGGLGHSGGFGHLGGSGHMGSGALGHMGTGGHMTGLGHSTSLNRAHDARSFADHGSGTSRLQDSRTVADKSTFGKTDSGRTDSDKTVTSDKFDRTVERRDRHDDAPPVFVPDYPTGGAVIADDPKPGPTTQEKPKAKACTWKVGDVDVEDYEKDTVDYIRGKSDKGKSLGEKLKEKLLEKAIDFVKKHAGEKWGKWFEVASSSVKQLKQVFITYVCVDDKGEVVDKRFVALEDEENMNWWAGGNSSDAQEGRKKAVIKHLPR